MRPCSVISSNSGVPGTGVYSMNWWKSVSCATACSISSLDVLGRVVLQPDDGRAEQLDAVLAQFAGHSSVSAPFSLA